MHSAYLEQIKTFEGFAPQASWDFAQYTNGYGTKARYPGETISRKEAQRRFEVEITEARKLVEGVATGWDEGTKAALTSLTFNAGPRWIKSGLGDAVRAHDVDAVRQRFMQYNKAGGNVHHGLASRRAAEADWIGKEAEAATQAASSEATTIVAMNAGYLAAPMSASASPRQTLVVGRQLSQDAGNLLLAEGQAELSSIAFHDLRPAQSLLEALFDLQLRLSLLDVHRASRSGASSSA